MTDLLSRCGDLKGELVQFSQRSQFARALQMARMDYFSKAGSERSGAEINFLDHFILQYKLPDGKTVLDHFLKAHPELPEDERAALERWHEVVEGIFEVERIEKEALIASNLIDDLTYRLRSNRGPGIFKQFTPGSFLLTRLVPFGDEWMLSGASSILPASSRREVYNAARELSLKAPARVFRNPEKLAQGWEMQRKEREEFIAFFGSDMVTVPVSEFAERMKAFMRYRTYEVRDEEGLTIADRALQRYGKAPTLPAVPQPDWDFEVQTIGIINDEQEGMSFYPDFGLVEETFADPELAKTEPHAEITREYIQSFDISPVPIRRLAERDPQKASQVFRNLFPRPNFSWKRDGEKFLRTYKWRYLDKTPLPSVVVLSDRLTQASLGSSPQTTLPPGSPKVAATNPVPVGAARNTKSAAGSKSHPLDRAGPMPCRQKRRRRT